MHPQETAIEQAGHKRRLRTNLQIGIQRRDKRAYRRFDLDVGSTSSGRHTTFQRPQ